MSKLYDNWDKRIFSEIEFNYKLSHRSIAKKIKRSKSFVSYRIKKMEENNLIEYRPLIDYSRIGLQYYRVIIETVLDKEELKKKISDLKLRMVWLVEKYDKENFVMIILAKNHSEFKELWDTIYERVSNDISSKDIHILYGIRHLPSTFFHKDKSLRRELVTGTSEFIDCTKDELCLLDLLIENPSITINDLSKKWKINSSKIYRIFRGLEEKKIILAYQTLLNKNTLNIKHSKIFLGFNFTRKSRQAIINVLKTDENVVYITESGYQYDLELELLTFNDAEIKTLVKKLKEDFDIKQIVLSQMMSEEKLC